MLHAFRRAPRPIALTTSSYGDAHGLASCQPSWCSEFASCCWPPRVSPNIEIADRVGDAAC
jgi:hypothetical protein